LKFDEAEEEYENKLTFHQMWHLVSVLQKYGPSPLIWTKHFEKDIGDIKSGNVSGPTGLIAMANRKNLLLSISLWNLNFTLSENSNITATLSTTRNPFCYPKKSQ